MRGLRRNKYDRRTMEYGRRYDYYSYFGYRYHHLFSHSLIFRGRKLWAFNFFVRLKYELKKREKVDPYWILFIALSNITPDLILYPLKLGGVLQKVPLPISERKQFTFAVKWVIKLLRDKYKSVTIKNLADTLISAVYGKGLSIEKKISVHEMSTLNRHLLKFFKH